MVYIHATQEFARVLADRGLHLVYGGGVRGLMGILANAMLEAGGTVTGVVQATSA
jgi:predicted Rossmann-fold nucleotide-binding protein